jgi:hypothetical protein
MCTDVARRSFRGGLVSPARTIQQREAVNYSALQASTNGAEDATAEFAAAAAVPLLCQVVCNAERFQCGFVG